MKPLTTYLLPLLSYLLPLLFSLSSCSTQKKVSAVEVVSTSDNSTHSLCAESVRLDSAVRSFTVEFDSLFVEMETTDSIPRRLRLQAKRASIGAQSQQVATLNEITVIADSAATQTNNSRESETTTEQDVAKPPNILLFILMWCAAGYIVCKYLS